MMGGGSSCRCPERHEDDPARGVRRVQGDGPRMRCLNSKHSPVRRAYQPQRFRYRTTLAFRTSDRELEHKAYSKLCTSDASRLSYSQSKSSEPVLEHSSIRETGSSFALRKPRAGPQY